MDTKQPVIIKSTVKMLKFIWKNPNITFEELQSKFEELDSMELVLLCLTDYLVCTKPGNLPTNFSDGRFIVAPEDEFWASPKTKQLLEERFQRRWQWIVPTVISAIALILSIVSFIMSRTPQVLEVRIVP